MDKKKPTPQKPNPKQNKQQQQQTDFDGILPGPSPKTGHKL